MAEMDEELVKKRNKFTRGNLLSIFFSIIYEAVRCTIKIKLFLIDSLYCAIFQHNLETVNIIVQYELLCNILTIILAVYGPL